MIEPVAGVHEVVSRLDEMVAARPRLRPMAVVVDSDTDAGRNFVAGFVQRLRDDRGDPLVPHATIIGSAAIDTTGQRPGVRVLADIAAQLRATIPAGAGRRWRMRRFHVCLDVVDAVKLGPLGALTGRRELVDHLYAEWERRTPLLAWVRKQVEHDEFPGKLLGFLLSALFQGPTRWWFGRRLSGRDMRWFTTHLAMVNGHAAKFPDHALWLQSQGEAEDLDPVRHRILLDALLHDLADFLRGGRFWPGPRRRRWTPVVLLDTTSPGGTTSTTPALSLVDLYVQLTEDRAVAPLVLIAAMDQEAVAARTTTPDEARRPRGAAGRLRDLFQGRPLPTAPWLPVTLERGEPDPVAREWLTTHQRVPVRPISRLSAVTPLALTVVLLVSAAGFGGYRYVTDGCADTRRNDLGERVGVIEARCSFDGVREDGVPHLTDLERRAAQNNAVVDGMKDGFGNARYHREVVFFGPLTRPADTPETTAPPNAIWQLEGALDAQVAHNTRAEADLNKVPVKLVLANSGDRYGDGDQGGWVADRIAERPADDRGDLAAVIGISQSRPKVSAMIGERLRGVPIVGASMYGSRMASDNPNMFLAAPLNAFYAGAMATWVKSRYGSAAVVYDDQDEYFSLELRNELRDRGIGSDDADLVVREFDSTPIDHNRVRALCVNAATTVPVLALRADQIRRLLDAADEVAECRDAPGGVRFLSGPGANVEVASGNMAKRKWLEFHYASLADGAVNSEKGIGADAFLVAAEAISRSWRSAGELWEPRLVLDKLRDPGFSLDGHTGKVRLNQKAVDGEGAAMTAARVRINKV